MNKATVILLRSHLKSWVVQILLVSTLAIASAQPGYAQSADSSPSLASSTFETYIDLEVDHFQPATYNIISGAIVIDAEINGHEVRALLDNGADLSLVDENLAHRLGLSVSDTSEQIGTPVGPGGIARRVNRATIEVPNQFSMETQALAVNLSSLSGLIGEKIELVIGNDIFSNMAVAFDTKSSLVYFKSPGGINLPGATDLDVDARYAIPVKVNGETLHLAVDLGRFGGPFLTEAAWSEAGLRNHEFEAQVAQDVFGVRSSIKVVKNISVEVGPGKHSEEVSSSRDPLPCSCDGLIGFSSLSGGGFVLDKKNGKFSIFQ